jgi:hypothetical protein
MTHDEPERRMASPGELIDAVADMFVLPRNAVAYPYRRLREAGAVSMSGRGRSAAVVTPRDAANLILAIIAELPLKERVEAWEAFSVAQTHIGLSTTGAPAGAAQSGAWRFEGPNVPGLVIPTLTALADDHKLTDALAALIVAGAEGTLATALDAPYASLTVAWESNLPSVRIAFHWSDAEVTGRWEVSRTYTLQAVTDQILSGHQGQLDLGRRSMLTTRKSFDEDVFIELGKLLSGGAS